MQVPDIIEFPSKATAFAHGNAPVPDSAHVDLFARIHGEKQAYYARWIHDIPMVVSPERDEELHEIQRVLYASACYFASHYRDWLDFVPLDEIALETLEYCERYPFHAGTYRPDLLLCEDGAVRVCEITSRFFGNGYFLSYFYDEAAREKCEQWGIDDRTSRLEDMLAYFAAMAAGKKRLVVLKSADRSDSIRLYVPYYEALGLHPTILEADQVESSASLLENAFAISALNQVDLANLSTSTRHLMADVGCRNDFRTIYLLHDKRFFRLFAESAFTNAFLTDEQTAFLRAHTVPTYLPHTDPEKFDYARSHKDDFIMKHHKLGKSEKVFAGCLTTQLDWNDLFEPPIVGDMILQPFQRQRFFPVTWEGQQFNDYACGAILTVDDKYFGPGIVRTSSCPVINRTDDRKFAHIVTAQANRFPAHYNF